MLTVVLKLLQIVRPDRAFFGEKDYQQLVLIRQMVADLNVDVRDRRRADRARVRRPGDVVAQPLPRAPRSASRPAHCPSALLAGMYAAGRRRRRPLLDAARAVLDEVPAIEVDYLEVRGPWLEPAPPYGPARLLVAARLGSTRLLDNIAIDLSARCIDALLGSATTAITKCLEELMFRTMLKSKIHRATVTHADLHYVGSVTIDADLMDAADLLEGEQVTIVDIDNGARLVTYVITGERGTGVIGINGAAAHLVHPGDLVILIAYGTMDDAEARTVSPAGGLRRRRQPADRPRRRPGPRPDDVAELLSPRTVR